MMKYFKKAEIVPQVVLAGDSVEFSIRLVLGKRFSARRSRIILDMPAYLGYDRPTRLHQESGGYLETFCSNPDIRYIQRAWDMEVSDFPTREKTSFQGMAQRIFVLDLDGRSKEGDSITFQWGWNRNGMGVGTKVSALVLKKKFLNTIHVRYFRNPKHGLPDYGRSFKGYDRPVPDEEIPLRFQIKPREPSRVRVFRRGGMTSVAILDRFWNVVPASNPGLYVKGDIRGMKSNSYGVFETSDSHARIFGKSLPLIDMPDMQNVHDGLNIYFGDLHVHSAYSNDCIEREKQEMEAADCYAYGRDVSCLDFMAVTDHHQPWDVERNKVGRTAWEKINAAADRFNRPGRFAAFPGLEFRCNRGDTVIICNERFRYDEIDDPSLIGIREWWKKFQGRNYISIPHFHLQGSILGGGWFYCPYKGVEPYLEIFSCHGSYERIDVQENRPSEIKRNFEKYNAQKLLAAGHIYGFGCNSDNHKGNPGSNGLTAVLTGDLTRDSILNAIRARHIYGTTNARIRMVVTVNDALMGSILDRPRRAELKISLAGTDNFKAIDINVDGNIIKRLRPDRRVLSANISLKTPRSFVYVRAIQADNQTAYSSPVWFRNPSH